MRLAEREQGLLRLVEQYRDEECRRRLAAARSEAAAILRQTYAKERARLHERAEAERHSARLRIEALLADRETRARRKAEQANALFLAKAWPKLEAALLARWRTPEGRRRWAERALDVAQQRLPVADQDGPWVIRHACDWSDEEQRDLFVTLRLDLRDPPRVLRDTGLRAGLIITAAGALLDLSLAGLLHDRSRLEARLLALLQGSGSQGSSLQGLASQGLGSACGGAGAPSARGARSLVPTA